MQKGALIRIAISLIFCFSVILYHAQSIFVPIREQTETVFTPQIIEQNSEKITETEITKEEQTEIKEETEEKTENIQSEKTESAAASAKDVKGKIISNYISPYNAPLSYDKVYMKNSTGVSVDIKKLLEASLSFKIEQNSTSPQVLIVHTHATESFMKEDTDYYTSDFSPRSRNNSENMVKIGEIVAEKLNNAGIKTLHDKTQHDYPEYTGSYSRSKTTINGYLKKYPSIKIVLDLHRDSISSGDDKKKLVTEISGKKAAQVMLVMGSETGSVSGFPSWKENLKLAFKLQQRLEEKYPTLARPLMLVSKLYNQNLTKGSLLIEFGTEANTLGEASYSAQLVADAISDILK